MEKEPFVVLRFLEEGDAEKLEGLANNRKIADCLRDVFPHPYALADAIWFIEDCAKQEGRTQAVRAIEVDGELAGCISLSFGQDVARFSCELGYWLAEPFWGKGVMTQAVCQMTEYAFSSLGKNRVFAQPFAQNFASQRVLEKAGFQREGVLRKSVYKNGVFQDAVLYAKVQEECGFDAGSL